MQLFKTQKSVIVLIGNMDHEFESDSGNCHCRNFPDFDFSSDHCRIENFDKQIVQRASEFYVEQVLCGDENHSFLLFIFVVKFRYDRRKTHFFYWKKSFLFVKIGKIPSSARDDLRNFSWARFNSSFSLISLSIYNDPF